MLTRFVFYTLLLCLSSAAFSQLPSKNSGNISGKKVIATNTKSADSKALLDRLKFFTKNASQNASYADSISVYGANAEKAFRKNNDQAGIAETYWLWLEGIIKTHDQQAGAGNKENTFKKADELLSKLNALHPKGSEKVAENFSKIGNMLNQKHGDQNIRYYEQAVPLFLAAGNKSRAAETLFEIGFAYNQVGNLGKAQQYYLKSIEIGKGSYRNIHMVYGLLGNTYGYQGDLRQALEYELQGIRIAKEVKDTSNSYAVINLFLGLTYEALKEYKEALEYYQEAYTIFKNYPENMIDLGSSATNVAKMMIFKDPAAAIRFLEEFVRQYPKIVTSSSYNSVQLRFMQAYQKLGNIVKGNEYCAALIKSAEKEPPYEKRQLYVAVVQYLLRTNQYTEAKKYLPTFKRLAEESKEKPLLREAAYFQFQIDSAAADYHAAMENYLKFKKVSDTILNEAKTKEISRLRVQFDTEKKDNELKLKEQSISLLLKDAALQQSITLSKDRELELRAKNIDLLKSTQALQQLEVNNANREVQLKDQTLKIKEQNIALLTKESLIKESNLRESKILRNVIIGGAVLLLILLLLLYNRYKLKQNIIAQMSITNSILKKTNTEKEWLLKEVHHRVKNNLQTVVSLLQSQAAYLQNDALHAIQDSQNRIHAMSLVHQKLYRTDNIASINMSVYLSDLVCHLFESYNTKGISYEVNAEPIDLDVSQAIPVGLIVNEAVTNSIKYAFEGIEGRAGKISISFIRKDNALVLLTLSDNGIGLDKKINEQVTSGLGIPLIKGLSDDLEGKFHIDSEQGTTISLLFEVSKPLQKHKEEDLSSHLQMA